MFAVQLMVTEIKCIGVHWSSMVLRYRNAACTRKLEIAERSQHNHSTRDCPIFD